MLLVNCPWCGPREEIEFRCGGEAHIARPKDPMALDDAVWAEYVFMRTNPKGWHRERWYHTNGCRRWFNVIRSTITHEIAAVYKMGAAQPPLPDRDPAKPAPVKSL